MNLASTAITHFKRLSLEVVNPASHLMTTIRQSGLVLAGNVAGGLLGILSLGLAAHQLSMSEFGALTIIVAYASLFNRLTGFQSWQTIIRYASMPSNVLSSRRSDILKIGLALDMMGAALSSLAAFYAAYLIGPKLGIRHDQLNLLAFFALSNITMIAGAPTAALRLFERHDLLAAHSVFTSAIRVAAISIVYLTGGGLAHCILAWAVSVIASNVALLALGAWVCLRVGIRLDGRMNFLAILEQQPGMLKNFVETNLIQSAKLLREADVLIIGSLLSPASAGLFRVAKQIGDVVVKATDPLAVVVFGRFAHMASRNEEAAVRNLLAGLVIIAALIGAAAIAGFYAFGGLFLQIAFGEPYRQAFWISLLLLAAGMVRVIGTPITPAILARGDTRSLLIGMVFSGLIYIAMLTVGASRGALVGAGLAILAVSIIWTAGQVFIFFRRPDPTLPDHQARSR